jgi:hypothetical protein
MTTLQPFDARIKCMGYCAEDWRFIWSNDAGLIEILVSYTSHQAFNSSAKHLRTSCGIKVCKVLQHSPHYPDFSPCNYHLIPKLNKPLHGKGTAEGIFTAVVRILAQISISKVVNGVCSLPHHCQQTVGNLRDSSECCQQFLQIVCVVLFIPRSLLHHNKTI